MLAKSAQNHSIRVCKQIRQIVPNEENNMQAAKASNVDSGLSPRRLSKVFAKSENASHRKRQKS